jgi:DNA polymerase-3 subunit beta
MRLRVDRQEFTDAIAWATRVAGSRAALPALTGVLLEAGEGRLTCSATDLEISAQIGVPATVERPGRTLLAARFLAQLVARFPDAPVDLEDDGDRVSISCGRAKFRVRRLQADDFPAMPAIDEQGKRGLIVKAGPYGQNDAGWRGMLLYDVDTAEEVEGWLLRDPFVKAGRLKYAIYPWWGAVGTKLP